MDFVGFSFYMIIDIYTYTKLLVVTSRTGQHTAEETASQCHWPADSPRAIKARVQRSSGMTLEQVD